MRKQMIQLHHQQTICLPFHRLQPVVAMLLRLQLTWKLLRSKAKPIQRMTKTWKYWHSLIVYLVMMGRQLLLSRTKLKLRAKSKHSQNQNSFRIMMQHLPLQVQLLPRIFNKRFSQWEAVLIWMPSNRLIQLKLVHHRNKNNNLLVEIKPLKLIYKVYNYYNFFRKIYKEYSNNNLNLQTNK